MSKPKKEKTSNPVREFYILCATYEDNLADEVNLIGTEQELIETCRQKFHESEGLIDIKVFKQVNSCKTTLTWANKF